VVGGLGVGVGVGVGVEAGDADPDGLEAGGGLGDRLGVGAGEDAGENAAPRATRASIATRRSAMATPRAATISWVVGR
jgi:hypothetical protein